MKSEEVQVSAAAVAARLGLTLRLLLTHKLNAFNYLCASWRAVDIQQSKWNNHAFCLQMPSHLQTCLSYSRYTQTLNIDLGSDLKQANARFINLDCFTCSVWEDNSEGFWSGQIFLLFIHLSSARDFHYKKLNKKILWKIVFTYKR